MRYEHGLSRICTLLLFVCATGLLGIAATPPAAAQASVQSPKPLIPTTVVPGTVSSPPVAHTRVRPPKPLIRTTVLPGETDLDKVYARERDGNRKAARKAADRQKYGLPEKTGERGHARKEAK
jgi:hypothetical protein